MKLRNTYQVPSGKEVTVQTPQGQKKYTGGQFVPPEQLGNMQVRTAEGGKEGKQENSDASPNMWEEIVQQFKMVNPTNNKLLNSASFNIRKYLSMPFNTTKDIAPHCKFAAELCIANLINSITGLQPVLQEIGLKITISNQNIKKENIVGKNFVKIGELNFKTNEVVFWQHEAKPEDLIVSVTEFLTHKLGISILRYLYGKMNGVDDQINKLNNELQTATQTLNNAIVDYSSKNKGKVPKPGQNESIDSLNQQVQEIEGQKSQIQTLQGLLDEIKEHAQKEISLSFSETDVAEGQHEMYSKVAKLIRDANKNSLAANANFMMGMGKVAEDYPDTVSAIRNLFDYLTELQAESQEQE